MDSIRNLPMAFWATHEDVENVFQRAKVSERYSEVRNCEDVTSHYYSVITKLKEKAEGNPVMQRLLDNGAVEDSIELIVKREIICKAVEQLIQVADEKSLNQAIVSVIDDKLVKELITNAANDAEDAMKPFSDFIMSGIGIMDIIMNLNPGSED